MTVSATENGQNPLEKLRASVKVGGSRFCTWGPGLLLAGFVIWGSMAELDEVAIAIGEVIPEQQLQIVQHLEGGVIEEILIQEGDLVEQGQVLMQLNLAAAGINREELQVRLDGLLLARSRLRAESEGGNSDPVFPETLLESRPELVEAELQAFSFSRNTAGIAT